MRKYELVVVLNGTLQESDVKKFQSKYEEMLAGKGAAELTSDYWGRREIAYEVKKTQHGHYVCFYFASEDSQILNPINDALRIDESVLLFQSHRLSERSRKFKGRLVKDDEEADSAAA